MEEMSVIYAGHSTKTTPKADQTNPALRRTVATQHFHASKTKFVRFAWRLYYITLVAPTTNHEPSPLDIESWILASVGGQHVFQKSYYYHHSQFSYHHSSTVAATHYYPLSILPT